MLSSHPSSDLSAIAAQAGFSDQSHMTREFQTFAGVTRAFCERHDSTIFPAFPLPYF